MPHIKSGTLKGLGVTALTRALVLPDVLPINESLPGVEVGSWLGLFVLAGVPRDIVTKLNSGVRHILALDDIKGRISALITEAATITPEQFVEFIRAEIAKWEKVVKVAGARVD